MNDKDRLEKIYIHKHLPRWVVEYNVAPNMGAFLEARTQMAEILQHGIQVEIVSINTQRVSMVSMDVYVAIIFYKLPSTKPFEVFRVMKIDELISRVQSRVYLQTLVQTINTLYVLESSVITEDN